MFLKYFHTFQKLFSITDHRLSAATVEELTLQMNRTNTCNQKVIPQYCCSTLLVTRDYELGQSLVLIQLRSFQFRPGLYLNSLKHKKNHLSVAEKKDYGGLKRAAHVD